MRYRWLNRKTEGIRNFLIFLIPAIIASLSLGIKVLPHSEGYLPWNKILDHFIDFHPFYSLGLAIIWGILQVIKWQCLDFKRLDDLDWVLNEFREELFKATHEKSDCSERVTLFKYVNWSFPQIWRGSILVPIARSGTNTRNSKKYFYAPDDGKGKNGVCGKSWAEGRSLYVGNLPDFSRYSKKNLVDPFIKKYSTKSFYHERNIKNDIKRGKGPDLPRSIFAFPIKTDTIKWGVVVIDSRHPKLPIVELEKLNQIIAKDNFFSLEKTLKRAIKDL